MSRRICVVTGSRAEYGLLRWVMAGIRDTPEFALQLVVTGTHLAPRYGQTWREIEADGFRIDRRIDLALDDDSAAGISRSMGLALDGLGRALQELQPDLMLVLGDRYEIFAAAAAATVARVPIAHLHGGETTEGAFDEAMRHSITKMSHLHFVAAEEFRRRVIQLGEDPARVFLVGGLGVDSIRRTALLDRTALEAALGFELGAQSLLVTFHPVTLEAGTAARQMSELLAALDALQDTRLIFTMPNADPDSRALFGLIENFVAAHPNSRAFTSLGQLRYLSCLRHVDGVVGNSSSGLTEVPSFGKGTVNIGDRQKGRLRGESVIDCAPERSAIGAALQRLRSPEFRALLETVGNPYGDGGASEKIVEVLRNATFPIEIKKKFFDFAAIPD